MHDDSNDERPTLSCGTVVVIKLLQDHIGQEDEGEGGKERACGGDRMMVMLMVRGEEEEEKQYVEEEEEEAAKEEGGVDCVAYLIKG